jgi:hypothetical protein
MFNAQRLHLKSGVQGDHAVKVLRELVARAEAVTVAGAGLASGNAVREAYIRWVEDVEAQLVYLTNNSEIVARFHTDRYWHISAIHQPVARPIPMVTAERDLRRSELTRLADDLERRIGQWTATPGRIAVLDTNVLMHYEEPDKIRWHEALGTGPWRLVIPLRVVEELDMKKYTDSPKLSSRARALLPRLEKLIGDDGAPRALKDGVTIEVPVERGPRARLVDADEEILAMCFELPQLTAAPVTLVTGDTGMRLRARAQATEVAQLPTKYRRKLEQTAARPI